jgi:hypothetical protein
MFDVPTVREAAAKNLLDEREKDVTGGRKAKAKAVRWVGRWRGEWSA